MNQRPSLSPEQLQSELARANEAARPLVPLLQRLAGPEWSALIEEFRPTDEDYARVFTDPEPFRAFYTSLWANPPRSARVQPGQTELRLAAATAAMLREASPATDPFPGGYRQVAPLLVSDGIWVAWKYVRPGSLLGTALDGLTRVQPDRWVWFPHPWRALASGGDS